MDCWRIVRSRGVKSENPIVFCVCRHFSFQSKTQKSPPNLMYSFLPSAKQSSKFAQTQYSNDYFLGLQSFLKTPWNHEDAEKWVESQIPDNQKSIWTNFKNEVSNSNNLMDLMSKLRIAGDNNFDLNSSTLMRSVDFKQLFGTIYQFQI